MDPRLDEMLSLTYIVEYIHIRESNEKVFRENRRLYLYIRLFPPQRPFSSR